MGNYLCQARRFWGDQTSVLNIDFRTGYAAAIMRLGSLYTDTSNTESTSIYYWNISNFIASDFFSFSLRGPHTLKISTRRSSLKHLLFFWNGGLTL